MMSQPVISEFYPPSKWIQLARTDGSKDNRRAMFVKLADLEGEKISINDGVSMDRIGVPILTKVLARIEDDPYGLARRFYVFLSEKRRFSSGYINNNISLLRQWLEVNEVNINDELWKARVMLPHSQREKQKGSLTREGVLALLHEERDPTMQAFYEIMANTGAYPSEAKMIEARDLDEGRILGIHILVLRKSRREAPIAGECFDLVRRILGDKPDPHKHPFEKLPSPDAIYHHMREQLLRLNLTEKKEWHRGDKEAYTVSLRNFRQFAEDNLRHYKMDFDEARWLVGRKAVSPDMTIERIAPKWKEMVEPFNHWLKWSR